MRDDLLLKRFQHAALRLRTRYGLDIDIEEYEKLCIAVANGAGVGKTVNDKGDWEVWVPFKEDMVCAAYKPSERLIATFFPRPPPLQGSPPQSLPDRVNAEIDQRSNVLASKIVESRVSKAVEAEVRNIRRRAETTTEGPLSTAEVRGADLKWFKNKITSVCDLLDAGQYKQARITAGALTDFRPNFHPTEADDNGEHMFKRLMEEHKLPAMWTEEK